MGETKFTEESFLDNVKNYKMFVLKDDDVYRHLQFKKDGTYSAGFDIVTYPGYLCVTGEWGDFIFLISRFKDPIYFFANKEGPKVGYWAEKVVAQSIFGNGIEEFDREAFQKSIRNYIKDHHDMEEHEPFSDEFEEEIRPLMWAEDEYECITALREFRSDIVNIDDWWEISNEFNSLTWNYQFCCYAINWGVRKYLESKDKE